jgi:carbohydrate-binding DOMON domain-containing protein
MTCEAEAKKMKQKSSLTTCAEIAGIIGAIAALLALIPAFGLWRFPDFLASSTPTQVIARAPSATPPTNTPTSTNTPTRIQTQTPVVVVVTSTMTPTILDMTIVTAKDNIIAVSLCGVILIAAMGLLLVGIAFRLRGRAPQS